MSELEQASKEMMAELNDIRAHTLEYQTTPLQFLNDVLEGKYVEISEWYRQQRYLANAQFKLIEHIFGDTPQFEEEKPKKYVVQSKKIDGGGDYWYVVNTGRTFYTFHYAYSPMAKIVVKFDTREEAEKWTNPLMEVVEVEE